MPEEPLDIIAASYKTLADTQALLAQTQVRMDETQRLGLRLQGYALVLIGLSLLGTGGLVWQHLTTRHEAAVLHQAVLANTQTIAAQTQVLLERLRQP